MKRLAALLIFASAVCAVAQQAPANPPPTRDNPWVYNNPDADWNQSWNQRANPNSGACFYTDRNYQGDHFCISDGDRLPALPKHFAHKIGSVQVFGNAQVRLFNDSHYSNGSTVLDHSVADLRDVTFRGGHTWNDRIGSVIVGVGG